MSARLFQRTFSAATASSTALWNLASSDCSDAASAERMSTSIHASNGIEFTDVPPPMRPTLKVVFGSFGTWKSPIAAIARPSAWIGFTIPKAP